MLQAHVTPLPLALVVAVHAACLLALVAAVRAPAPQFPGWRVVRPGPMHWIAFFSSWGFAMLITWVWLFVGSARHDADEQMRSALFIALALGLIAALSGFHLTKLYRSELRWRGPVIRWREGNRDMVQTMGNCNGFRRSPSGLFHFRFRDGTTLKLDISSRSARELAIAISRHIGRDIAWMWC